VIEIRRRLAPAEAAAATVAGALCLSYERRQRTRQRVCLSSGEHALLMLPRGQPLRAGEHLLAGDGRVFEVIAQAERLLQVACGDAATLARVAWHLGNRHVPVEIRPGVLRLAPDHVLAAMLSGLGLAVEEIDAPFQPEPGAYAQGNAASTVE